MPSRIVIGKRRFTCLSSGLVRLEFSASGRFEDRRSLVAHEPQKPVPFRSVRRAKNETILETARMTVITRKNDRALFPDNLEIRWKRDGLLHFWRPGDRDSQNLGGTIRALDMFSRHAELSGVHTADVLPPDAKGLGWISWDICEVEPAYYKAVGREDLLREMRAVHPAVRYEPRKVLTRMLNRARDTYRYPPGLLSRSGYFLLNDSESAVLDRDGFPIERNTPGTQDWYFFSYGDDYKTALADFVLLSGRAPLPTKNTFGLIFSRWPAYDEKEARQIIGRFAQEGIPLSALVLDMEWHKPGWCHWDWEERMYADPAAFFRWCHENGLEVTLNVHPLRVESTDSHFPAYLRAAGTKSRAEPFDYDGRKYRKVDVDIACKQEARAFFRICHDPIVKQGLDYWWVDGSRGTLNGTCDQLVTNKLYFENVETPTKRGMLLSRYGGLGSHRYGVFFTGDTHSEWEVLAKLCEFNIRAGHAGVGYISHDTGGFSHPSTPLIDPVRYLRWLQFGVFNPVLRFHSAPGSGSRQPWDYGEENFRIARRWLRIRNSLAPYLYTAARGHHDTGVPPVRGLFLENPRDEAAYRFDEFYFGDALLVAPILGMNERREVYLPAGDWYEFLSGRPVAGGRTFGVTAPLAEIPVYVKAGSILCRQTESVSSSAAHVAELILDVYPGRRGEAILYEDDGKTPAYKRGVFCRTRFDLSSESRALILRGRVTQGRPLGKTRRVFVDLPLARRPKRILLDGKALPATACAQDEESGRWRVALPERPSARAFVLRIERG